MKPQLPPDPGAPKVPPPMTPETPITIPNTPQPSPPPSPGTKSPVARIVMFCVLTVFGLSLSSGVHAQSVRYTGDEPTYVMINDSAVGSLTLENSQRLRLEAVELRHEVRREDLLAQRNDLEEAEFRARMNSLSSQRVDEVKAILTPEQFERWSAMGGGREGFADDAALKKDPTRP